MEQRQEEQGGEQRKSSIDRVNDFIKNAKDNAERVHNAGKNLRRGYNAAKTARAGATALRAGATAVQGAEALGTGAGAVVGGVGGGTVALIIFLILLIILLIIMIFVVVFGGTSRTIAGTGPVCEGITASTTTPINLTADNCSFNGNPFTYSWTSDVGGTFGSPTGQLTTFILPSGTTDATITLMVCDASNLEDCSSYRTTLGASLPDDSTTPTCLSGDYLACLKNQFGITMKGSYTITDLKIIYNGFAVGFKYPQFLAWFKSVHPTITVSSYSTCPSSMWCSGAWATVQSGAIMTLYQKFLNAGSAYRTYVLVHEAAHMAMQASSTANNTQYTLYKNAYTNGLDRNCYDSIGIIKTYPSNIVPSSQLTYGRKVAESWADSVTDTIFCKNDATCPSNGGGGASIYDFPNACDYIYNYVRNALD